MKYELGNGKTVFLTFEEWLELDDEKIQELISKNSGIEIDDPFVNFDLKEYRTPKKVEAPHIDGIDDLTEEQLKSIEDEIKDELGNEKETDS